ncbi:MAG: CinA family protein [Victivallaceae bacterium]|nr:CinA family protein [Victivallaceae bacterium]
MTLCEKILKKLAELNLTLGTAESCTGGMIASEIVSVPGASAVFKGGVVSYANEIKRRVLGVNSETLEKHGAVSGECVQEMLAGACRTLNVDCAVAVSGVAGPDGGTAEKPVGLVYVGAVVRGVFAVERCRFDGDRGRIRAQSAARALEILFELTFKHGSCR